MRVDANEEERSTVLSLLFRAFVSETRQPKPVTKNNRSA
jgi:hypothetical protein